MSWIEILLYYVAGMFAIGLPFGILSLKALKYKERKLLRYLVFPCQTMSNVEMPRENWWLVFLLGITIQSLHKDGDDKCNNYIAATMLIWPLRLLMNALTSLMALMLVMVFAAVASFGLFMEGLAFLLKHCKRCIKI